MRGLWSKSPNMMFFTYGILSQKLKMSETTKDTEMEPCMTQKSKKKVRKNSFVTFVKKRTITAENVT